MPDSKIVSCTATADARQQNQMLSRKRRCRTAKSFPAQQPRMLDSKTRCCLGKNLPDSMKLFAKHVFFHPARQSIDRGLFEKTSKTFHPPRVGGTACAEESAMVHHYCPRT